ncbi:hypothetical protein SeMB42_g03612 [Synchytrium endobioticum]|uniref:Uncharacterized protein n=1 Tax=Synchytrium endobioticum TaxID=286115 RepID=A0A507D766_9FUNG|nr:hypothetical protein SeMB42_g03612 [Synchytrium endobioticum]
MACVCQFCDAAIPRRYLRTLYLLTGFVLIVKINLLFPVFPIRGSSMPNSCMSVKFKFVCCTPLLVLGRILPGLSSLDEAVILFTVEGGLITLPSCGVSVSISLCMRILPGLGIFCCRINIRLGPWSQLCSELWRHKGFCIVMPNGAIETLRNSHARMHVPMLPTVIGMQSVECEPQYCTSMPFASQKFLNALDLNSPALSIRMTLTRRSGCHCIMLNIVKNNICDLVTLGTLAQLCRYPTFQEVHGVCVVCVVRYVLDVDESTRGLVFGEFVQSLRISHEMVFHGMRF